LKEIGIGIDNVKKRLELNYKNHYQLENTIQQGYYLVNLEIEMKPYL